jgi:biopolymer transport protein ExbD
MKARRFARGGDAEVMMDINTTPLIDVMLVLLVMLIITIPIQLHAVNLEMPVGKPPSDVEPEKIQIDIDEKSTVYWQGLPVSAQELEGKMQEVAVRNPQPVVAIRPNKDASYAVFANVLSTSKRKGLDKMTVLGAEQFVQ